jgi:hypothetical protein
MRPSKAALNVQCPQSLAASVQRSWLIAAASVMPLGAFLFVYGPAAGHGFISDDFGWIRESRVANLWEAAALFGKNHGFYRPLVALSFAANDAAFGNHPLGYGLTNLALCLLCAGLIALTFQALELPGFAAAFGAAVWLLNFHGINMAILWTSGRTALLASRYGSGRHTGVTSRPRSGRDCVSGARAAIEGGSGGAAGDHARLALFGLE